MRTQVNEAQAIYKRTEQQQDMGRIAVAVITKEDYAAFHEGAGQDIEKIAQAAGVEMLKTARI
ncbi:MAG: hypothetical protein NC086_10660, partial [Alistipes sp.]|nr:hypothetical protein [Alistipes sp.]